MHVQCRRVYAEKEGAVLTGKFRDFDDDSVESIDGFMSTMMSRHPGLGLDDFGVYEVLDVGDRIELRRLGSYCTVPIRLVSYK